MCLVRVSSLSLCLYTGIGIAARELSYTEAEPDERQRYGYCARYLPLTVGPGDVFRPVSPVTRGKHRHMTEMKIGSGCAPCTCMCHGVWERVCGSRCAPCSLHVSWSLGAGVHVSPACLMEFGCGCAPYSLLCHGDVFTNICMYMLRQHTFEFSKSLFVLLRTYH